MDIVIDPAAWGRAAAGGLLIGLAATLMIVGNGRIAGVSGVFGGLFLDRDRSAAPWRAAFVSGLVLGALVVGLLLPGSIGTAPVTGWAGTLIAGLLVGFGTRLGSGCTSGHGVCGIGRLSLRSLIATMVFMVTGALTVFVIRHLLAGAQA